MLSHNLLLLQKKTKNKYQKQTKKKLLKSLSGIYQGNQIAEAQKPTEHNNGTQGGSQQAHTSTARLSGSDYKSTNRIDTIGGGVNSNTSSSGGGESLTPPWQQRRLAKSFSVAPSSSHKG